MNWPKPLRVPWSLWGMVWLAVLTGLGSFLAALLSLCRLRPEQMQWIPRTWARLLLWGVGIRVRAAWDQPLDPRQPYVFASNHTSALDIPALLTVLPANFRWIAKKELFAIPVFGSALRRMGYIPIDRSDSRAALKSLNQAARRIAEGASVVIFPEGTRNSGPLLPFKSGGLALAIRARRPVVPVAIAGAAQCLAPKDLWLSPGTIRVTLGTPIPTAELKMRQRDELAQQVQQAVQELLDRM